MAYYDCPYCGKERPHSHYGGVGPCTCHGYVARESALAEHNEAEAERKRRDWENSKDNPANWSSTERYNRMTVMR